MTNLRVRDSIRIDLKPREKAKTRLKVRPRSPDAATDAEVPDPKAPSLRVVSSNNAELTPLPPVSPRSNVCNNPEIVVVTAVVLKAIVLKASADLLEIMMVR